MVKKKLIIINIRMCYYIFYLFDNMFRRTFSSIVSTMTHINNFSQHNLKYILKFNFIENNIEHSSNTLYKNYIFKYSTTIHFEKNGLVAQKTFNSNDLSKLIQDINDFIANEIKL